MSLLRPVVLLSVTALLATAQSAAFRWIRTIGGSGGQTIAGLATDSQGNIYVAGNTTSLDFPVTGGAVQPHPAGSGLYRVDAAGSDWRNLYQAGVTATYALAVDPHAPNSVYAGTASGILHSKDAGVSWTSAASFGVRVNAIALDPANTGVIYAATQGQGIYKSTDGGAAWTAINNGVVVNDGQRYVFGIWVDPNNSAVLFASAFQGATLRSSDAGANWIAISSPALPYQTSSVAFDPFQSGTIYATDVSRAAISTDDGLTWSSLARVDSAYWQPSVIVPDPQHDGLLYAGSQDSLWKSADRGTTWTRIAFSAAPVMTLDASTGTIYAVLGARLVVTTDGFATTATLGPTAFSTQVVLSAAGGRVFAGAQTTTDVFVAKLDPQGNTVFATYFGGSAQDLASAMTVDAAGNVYVTGTTQSIDFPFTAGAYSHGDPAFLFKLNSDGSLAYATGLKGGIPAAIAVDAASHAVVVGVSSGNLPVTSGAYQTKFQGTFCGLGCIISVAPTNGFATEFDAAGASLVYSTYLGTQSEAATAVTVASDGGAVVAGQHILYHLDSAGASLVASKSFRGDIRALSLDGKGNILVAGATQDPAFPTTAGAFQTALYRVPSLPGSYGNTGAGDVFVTRLDAQLNVVSSTLLAGEAPEVAFGVAPATNGNIIVGGSTYSKAFPARGPVQSSFSPATGFVSQLTPDLSSLVFSTFTGDARPFYVRSVAAAADGAVIFAGSTTQAPYFGTGGQFPDPTTQAYVVRADPVSNAAPRIDSVVNAASQLATPLSSGETIQLHGDGFGDDAALYLNGDLLPLLSHDRTTLTAALPAAFAPQGAATLEVRTGGSSATILAPAAPASPGIFSRDGTGLGPGYIFNKDGTLNSPTSPAMEGDPITILATGVGAMTFDHGYAVTDAVVDVRVDGFSAAGIAAVLGPVAGLPGDVYQISVFVPHPSDFAASNPNLNGFVMPPQVGVNLVVSGAISQAGISLAVGH